jgi:Ser/Thr protein kinase RdoA (MazF antagonist)
VDEVPLAGGFANAGKVFKVGETVRRPAGEHVEAVHQLLAHLDRVGFAGAPRALGFDEHGREILTWVPGTTYQKGPDLRSPVIPPSQLASLGRLIRSYHDAVASFVPTDGTTFANHPRSAAGTLIAHRDVCLENVVFRDGEAVALIDFDFAGPADALWDIAIAARHFVPIADPADLDGDSLSTDDVAARIRVLTGAYELDDAALPSLVAAIHIYLQRGYVGFQAAVDAGSPAHLELAALGFGERSLRAKEWLLTNADQIAPGSSQLLIS